MAGPAPKLIGEYFTDALPTDDPTLYGTAEITPTGAFEARSFQTFHLTYTAGGYGLDDTGSIRIVFRFTADGGELQMHDPSAPNYATATASNGTPLKLSFDANGHVRPWYRVLSIFVHKGCLAPGDRIEIIVGDRSQGSPGHILQSMCETAFTWRVLADVCATGHFVPIAKSPTISIVPGPPAVWKVVLPTLWRPGEVFRLGIKAEDLYGNPSDKADCWVSLDGAADIEGLPERVRMSPGARSMIVEGLSIDAPGNYGITLKDEAGIILARSNPIKIENGNCVSCWADMHGQSGETVGLKSAREYFSFARDLAFLDAASHQGNDFQINNAFWSHINRLTATFQEDDRFLTLPGYEWSGNTGVGGDRNVYFRDEGRTIRRSSHALLADRSDIHLDAPTAKDLFDALKDEDCVVYAHIGGRPANITFAHDPRLETSIEIHSAWGTFEWLLRECFEQGYRVGVVANNDGHKGRPGASYPGTSQFGAYGGLTCFPMERLTRDELFKCLRQRRHYATTGARIHVELSMASTNGFVQFDVDPLVGDGGEKQTKTLQMGAIARTDDNEVTLTFRAHAAKPIQRIDVLNGMINANTVQNPAPTMAMNGIAFCGVVRSLRDVERVPIGKDGRGLTVAGSKNLRRLISGIQIAGLYRKAMIRFAGSRLQPAISADLMFGWTALRMASCC